MNKDVETVEMFELGVASIETKGPSVGAPEEIGNQSLGIDSE